MASGVHNLLIYYRFCRPGGPLAEVIKGDVIIGSEATPDTAAVTRQPIFHRPLVFFSPQCEPDSGFLVAGSLRDPPLGGPWGGPLQRPCTCQPGLGRASWRRLSWLGHPRGCLGWEGNT